MASPVDIAWAAGLFEGEGTATISGAQRQPRLTLSMTDEDVVRRFAQVVARGNVRSYRAYGPRRKPQWQWSVQSGSDVLEVSGLLWPHLGLRRQERLTEVIERATKIGEPRNLGDWRKRTGLCKRGHDLSDGSEHLYVHAKSGKRHCRTCRREYGKGWRLRPVAS